MKKIISVVVLNLCFCTANATDKVFVGKFSADDLTGWEVKEFKGITHYQLKEQGYTQVLKAESHAAASGLVKTQRIDLDTTPYLNWQWRIEKRLGNMDEQTKSGDDYAARIYIIVSGGWAFWRTRAINYVWSANQEKEAVWSNAFAGKNAMMIALRGRQDAIGVWYQEKRNIRADLKQQFGENIRYIDAVAIMTDTDNAGGDAVSYYGDIFFSAD